MMKQSIKHNFFNHSRAFLLSGVALLMGVAPAHALPGQNLKTVRQWAKESFVLPPALIYNPQYDAYTGIRTIDGGLLALYVKVRPQDQVSVREQIVTQLDKPKLSFARNDAEGLKLIERIYTPEIADDFRNSKYVAQIGQTDFYQGKRFVYTTLQQQGIRRFSIMPLSELNQSIQRQVACQNGHCVVYQPFYPPKRGAGL
ncbi:hypothetical protein K9N68_36595 (plasmid) [Kovacikia minuta CCNUW1]|uniref:hypothetical protein n=1 Tax=Kovacikia minuta TaxID=2931930 RepID=UPI001CCA985E|nr:hypothetical protein [Kovacikia minuta]UBF30684.1 hypothetical protein K9N68_36595 [Kovacikia minuta CCNUW1]